MDEKLFASFCWIDRNEFVFHIIYIYVYCFESVISFRFGLVNFFSFVLFWTICLVVYIIRVICGYCLSFTHSRVADASARNEQHLESQTMDTTIHDTYLENGNLLWLV